MKHVPSWFPGAGFKHKAKEWKDLLPYFINKPFDDVMARVVCSALLETLGVQMLTAVIGIGNSYTVCSQPTH